MGKRKKEEIFIFGVKDSLGKSESITGRSEEMLVYTDTRIQTDSEHILKIFQRRFPPSHGKERQLPYVYPTDLEIADRTWYSYSLPFHSSTFFGPRECLNISVM